MEQMTGRKHQPQGLGSRPRPGPKNQQRIGQLRKVPFPESIGPHWLMAGAGLGEA